jgi:hypothetical protein
MSKRKITGNDGNDFDLSLNNIIKNIEVKGGQSLSGEDLLNLMKDEIFTLEAKRQKALLSSFSNVLWKDIAPKFGLLASGMWHQFDHLVVLNASLPPSFHRKVMWITVQWLDVYQEREAQDQEAACVRLMDAVCTCHIVRIEHLIILFQWHIPICALFKGCLVDRPKVTMPATKESSCYEHPGSGNRS